MYNNKIKAVHLEITDKCNAACPQCPRSDRGGPVNPLLPITELTLADIKKIFPREFILQLERMFACGNYGDPCSAKDTYEIFEYFRSINKGMSLSLNTNGGVQPVSWWTKLGELFTERDHVTFSIDGLEDTNHIYRRNVKWSSVMRNAKAFIAAGGKARWDFIVFKHNEHQVDEARALSEELGFSKFEFKKTGRFYNDGAFIDSTPVKNLKGEIVDKIERPSDKWQNNALSVDLVNLTSVYGTMDNYYDKTPVRCKVEENQSIYVNADGYVFPCCWVGGMATYNAGSQQKAQVVNLLNDNGGIGQLDAKIIDINTIINGDFFNAIENSWGLDSIASGKLKICSRICGVNFDQYGKQKTN